jgi:hypothetical protein
VADDMTLGPSFLAGSPTMLPFGPIAALKKRTCGSKPPFSSAA